MAKKTLIFLIIFSIILIISFYLLIDKYVLRSEENYKEEVVKEEGLKNDKNVEKDNKSISLLDDIKNNYCNKNHFEKVTLNIDIKSQAEFDKYIDELLAKNEVEQAAFTIVYYSNNNLNNAININSKKEAVGNLLGKNSYEISEFLQKIKNFNEDEIKSNLKNTNDSLKQSILIYEFAELTFNKGDFDNAYYLQNCLARNYRYTPSTFWLSKVFEGGTNSFKSKYPNLKINNPIEKNLYEKDFWYGVSFYENKLSIFRSTFISVAFYKVIITDIMSSSGDNDDSIQILEGDKIVINEEKKEMDKKINEDINNFLLSHYNIEKSLFEKIISDKINFSLFNDYINKPIKEIEVKNFNDYQNKINEAKKSGDIPSYLTNNDWSLDRIIFNNKEYKFSDIQVFVVFKNRKEKDKGNLDFSLEFFVDGKNHGRAFSPLAIVKEDGKTEWLSEGLIFDSSLEEKIGDSEKDQYIAVSFLTMSGFDEAVIVNNELVITSKNVNSKLFFKKK